MSEPKVLLASLTTGSGVETCGLTIKSMFEGKSNFIHFQENQPTYKTLMELCEIKPDVIIMNELHQRNILAVHQYKISHPNCKIILLNHCHPYITDYPLVENSPLFEWTNSDGVESINYFLKDGINHIINLNYIPPDKKISSELESKVIRKYFPIHNKFRPVKPPMSGRFDFLFYGTVHPLKFSVEFVEKFNKQNNMDMHVYGRWLSHPERIEGVYGIDYEDYKKSIIESKRIHYHGWMPEENMVDIITDHKCFIMPHDGTEPFCIALAEAIRCGLLAMVVNGKQFRHAQWIDWAKGNFLQYDDVDTLLEKMKYFTENKHNVKFGELLVKAGWENSREMTKKTSYDDFKEMLFSLIY